MCRAAGGGRRRPAAARVRRRRPRVAAPPPTSTRPTTLPPSEAPPTSTPTAGRRTGLRQAGRIYPEQPGQEEHPRRSTRHVPASASPSAASAGHGDRPGGGGRSLGRTGAAGRRKPGTAKGQQEKANVELRGRPPIRQPPPPYLSSAVLVSGYGASAAQNAATSPERPTSGTMRNSPGCAWMSKRPAERNTVPSGSGTLETRPLA